MEVAERDKVRELAEKLTWLNESAETCQERERILRAELELLLKAAADVDEITLEYGVRASGDDVARLYRLHVELEHWRAKEQK